MYKILDFYTDEENNVELRLAEIDNHYSIGVYDLDGMVYYHPITMFDKNKLFGLKDALTYATEKFNMEKKKWKYQKLKSTK